jgi:hypothetical protein
LYVERTSTTKKKATAAMPSSSAQQQAQNAVHMPFVPPKKMQKISSNAPGHSTSQAGSHSSARLQRPRSQTIPMSEVVTEAVPTKGRMKWYLGGNKKSNMQGGEGGDE